MNVTVEALAVKIPLVAYQLPPTEMAWLLAALVFKVPLVNVIVEVTVIESWRTHDPAPSNLTLAKLRALEVMRWAVPAVKVTVEALAVKSPLVVYQLPPTVMA